MNQRYAIVCIDDEETILDSLSMELDGRFPGVELELLQDNAEAETLVAGLLAAGVEVPVVVCDYIMPGRRGDAVLAAIHRLAPAARTVMLTGQSSLEGVTNAINQANLYRYIAKPWDKDDLALTLQGALESYIQEVTIQRQNQALLELNDNLERKVAERTEALRTANASLTEANLKIGEYLGIIDRQVLICRISRAGLVTYASEAFCRRSGYTRADLIGLNYWHALYSATTETLMRDILIRIERGDTWEGEILHQCRNGEYYWAREIISPDIGSDGSIVGFTSIRQDITDKKAVEALSVTDPLTGLANRRQFQQVLEGEIARARRGSRLLAFCLLDVDHFKAYNDHYGHAAGDKVLQRLGRLLTDTFKRGCDFTFRIGGEEFALLFPVRDAEEAAASAAGLVALVEAQAIVHAFGKPGPHLTISMGVRVVAPEERGLDVEQLFLQTDALLYRAKHEGRNRYVLQADEPQARAVG